jgi:hypothetical protein
MIYIAAFNDTPATDSAFASRGQSKMKQGPVSSSSITVFPTRRQIAYDGYNKNIDAFLAATANKQTYNVSEQFYKAGPVQITFPLTIPSANLSFKVTDKALLKRVLDSIDQKSSKEKILGVGSHPNAYVIDKPTWKMVDGIQGLLKENAPHSTGKTTFGALKFMKKAYECVELYLRTNTYPAFREKEGEFSMMENAVYSMAKRMRIDDIMEVATKKLRYPVGVNMTHELDGKKNVKEDGIWIGDKSDDQVEFAVVIEGSPVLHAKASPAEDSTLSFSSPSQAPKLPGILFPYFPGMNTPDASFIRSIMNRLFFRCFESKEAYIQFRQSVSSWASTDRGIELAHIFKGIEISLDAQGQLHLLFDGEDYLGFVVYGECWTIQIGNRYFVPANKEDLQVELSQIRTHAASLVELERILAKHGVMFDNTDVRPVTVAEALSKIEWTGNEEKTTADQKELDELVGRLDFGTRPIGVGPDTFLEALSTIVTPGRLGNQHIHFLPAKDFHMYSSREGLVLSRFGSRVPSTGIFKSEKEVKISPNFKSTAKDAIRKAALAEVPSILIALKPLKQALADYHTLILKKKLTSQSKERASNFRHMQFGKGQKDTFLVGVADLMDKWPEDTMEVGSSTDKGKGKRTADEADLEEGPVYSLDF